MPAFLDLLPAEAGSVGGLVEVLEEVEEVGLEGDGAGFAAVGDADGAGGVEVGEFGREEDGGIGRGGGDSDEVTFAEAGGECGGFEVIGVGCGGLVELSELWWD